MSSLDLLNELRAGRPSAPESLRERVGAIGPQQPTHARRWTLRRAVLVLAPASVAVLVGSAVIYGIASSGSGTTTRQGEGSGAASTLAGQIHRAPIHLPSTDKSLNNLQREGAYGPAVVQGGAPQDSRVGGLPPSQVRLQQYTASLRVRVRDLDHLSSATKQAMRVTRRLGGYVASVDFGTPGGKAGEAYLSLRVPVGRVQQAVMSFSNLGTILSQQVSILDVQGQVNDQIRQISILRTQIAIVERTLRDPSLSAEARARLQVQLVGQKQRLAGLLRQKAATTKRARLAQVSLALTTHKTAAATKPHHRGRLGRALDDAGSILAREAAIALYALIIVGPFLLLAAAGVAGGRLLRRRGEQRLLERTS